MSFCQLQLTCKDSTEASRITKALLDRRLIACAKQVPVKSSYLWKGKASSSNEVLLVMDSRSDLFDQVEAEVAALHSYEVFTLMAAPATRVSSKAQEWLESSLRSA